MFRRRRRSNVKFRFDRIGRDPKKQRKKKKTDAKPEDLNRPRPAYANRTHRDIPSPSLPTSNFNFAAIPVKSEKPSGNQKISTRVGTPLLAPSIL